MAMAALAVALTAYLAHILWTFRYLPGTDAYYYALQAQSLLDHGRLKVPDHKAIHYAVAAIAALGLSIETAFRVMLTAIFAVYQAGMVLLLGRLKGPSQPMAALLWILATPLVLFHTIEFPSLTLALATLPIWFWLAMEPTIRHILALAILLAAGFLAHPAAAALALLFAATLAAGNVQSWRRLPGRRALTLLAITGAGCLACLIVAATMSTGWQLRLSSFRPGTPGMLALTTAAETPSEIKFTVVILWLLLSLLLVTCWKIYPRRVLFLSLATLALPLWPDRFMGLGSVGGRLSLIFVLLALPLLVVVGRELGETHRFPSWAHTAWIQRSAVLAAVMAMAVLPLRLQSVQKLLMTDDYPTYEKVVASLHDMPILILIAHRGLDFFYSYRLRRDAFHFDAEPEWNQAEVWRAAARVTPEELAYYSPQECAWGRTAKIIRGTQYLLVREDCWEKFRSQLNRSDNPDLYAEVWEDMENPSQSRPAFLRVRHPLSISPAAEEVPR